MGCNATVIKPTSQKHNYPRLDHPCVSVLTQQLHKDERKPTFINKKSQIHIITREPEGLLKIYKPGLLGSKYVLRSTSMHHPKVGDGTSILFVAYVGSYLLFSIPNLQRCKTYKGTTIIKGTIVAPFK
jgi:hypothetical protein